jgi:hypothetical protein
MGSPNNVLPQQARAALAANSVIGRFQGPELFHSQSVDLSAPVSVQIPRVLNLTRPLAEILIDLRFRVAVTVANYTDIGTEAPQNILQRIRLQGIHRKFGAVTPIDISGATAWVWPRLFQEEPGFLQINGTRPAVPTIPFAETFLGTTAGSPYDIIVQYRVPLYPMLGPAASAKKQASAFFFMPQDWADSLQLRLDFGDKSALGDPTGATVAFTAFGSGAGLPSLSVHLNYAILGQVANGMNNNGVTIRNEQLFAQFSAIANKQRLSVLQKQITTNAVIKSGTVETGGQSAGVFTLEALSDVFLENTQILVDNKPIRNNNNNIIQKNYYGGMFNTVYPQGYLNLSFVEGMNALLAYRGDGLPAGSQFELVSDVLVASANTRIGLVQEMVYGGPFPALRP